jgi:hypothetical protein
MALELIQNADDAKAEEITFDVTDAGLWVRNSGTFDYCGDLHAVVCPFQASEDYSCDYHRIVDVASGGKLGQSENIGRFGIGFVSSYQITDHPRIQSSGISLTLKPEAGEWELEPCEETPGTEFFLPWAQDPTTKARQALGISHVSAAHIDRLTEDLASVVRRSLLFLRHVTRAEVRRNGTLLAGCDLDRGDGTDLIVSFHPGDEVEHWHILRADAAARVAALYASHPRLEGLRRSTRISIGVRVDPEPVKGGLLYAFLPTEQSTGLPLHINADFFPESDRKAVIFAGLQHEQAWNEMLIDVAAVELARDPVALRATLGDAQFWQVLSDAYGLQSRPSGQPTIFKQFWERLKPACANAPIVLAHDKSLRRPNETILPYRPLFTPRQVEVLRGLGGHVAIDSLQTHRNAMNQLGAQILTLDRLLNLIHGGLSGLKAGESEVEPDRVEAFYEPLWAMLADLLPELGTPQSPAMTNAIQRLKALPAIVSEDLFCVTIDQSYAAPTVLNSARIAELLPRLSIASKGLGTVPKILSLVATLDLAGVVKHLSGLALDGSLADGGISAEPKDLKDLYNLFADLDIAKQADESVYKDLRALPVWLSTRGLISAQAALLPGNFTDPSGVGDLLDTTVLSERARQFVSTKLGVLTQSIETFVKTVVPSFFGADGPADAAKYEALVTELANHPSLLDDEDARRALGALPMVPTRDGGWARPVETYRRTESLVRVLGDTDALWLDTSRIPKARSVQSFLESLGLRSTPMAEHLVDRMIAIAEDELPTDEAKRASAEAFYVLCDNFEIWKNASFFQDALGDLRQAACFPADGDADEWHAPDTLYAIYSAEAFRSQAKIVDFRNTNRLKTSLLEALGIKINPETALVVGHLRHCMENGVKPSDVVYRVLNDRASQDKAAIEILADTPCIYVEALKSFVHPNQLFWSAQQLGRFAFTIPPNLNSYRPLFDALGVSDGPAGADYVRIIREVSDEYFMQSKVLHGQDRAVFDLCWRVLAGLHDRGELDADDVRELQEAATVVNVSGSLVDPDEVLIQDSEWYAGFFDGELDSALCKPLPELLPLLEEVGVRLLSERARVALESTDGDEMDEANLASTLAARSDLVQRLLHDKPESLRKAVALGLSDLTAASFEVVRIQASVRIGDDDVPPQPASPIRASAFYDRETHVLSVERPVGDRSWPHVLNALLHQLIPDAAGSEVPKLTLILRPLMALPVEDGHRELSDAGVPELEDIAVPEVTEDVTSPELGEMGGGAETQDGSGGDGAEGDVVLDEADELRPDQDDDDTSYEPDTPSKAEHQTRSEDDKVQQPVAQPTPPALGQAPGSTGPTGPAVPVTKPTTTRRPVGPGTGAKKPRPKHKVQRDKRLLSYVNHAGGDDSDSDDGSSSEHNMAIEAVARDAVCKYEIARGRTPKQMPLTHPGYDIASQDMVRGTQRLIEVKGVAGEWNKTGVGLSKLQFTHAQEYPEQYWLYVVEFVSDPPNLRIHPIAKPATQVTSFMFDGNWRAVVDEEPVDPVIAFRAGARVKHQDWGYGRIASVDVRGSMRLLAVDFDKNGRRTVTLSVHTMQVVGEDEDGDASA